MTVRRGLPIPALCDAGNLIARPASYLGQKNTCVRPWRLRRPRRASGGCRGVFIQAKGGGEARAQGTNREAQDDPCLGAHSQGSGEA